MGLGICRCRQFYLCVWWDSEGKGTEKLRTVHSYFKFVHFFGLEWYCPEFRRYDIENWVWTTRNNMPIHVQSRSTNAIEQNGLIHVATGSHPVKLYCHNPVDDTWRLKTSIATSHAVFARTSFSLYVVENSCVLHRYDPTVGALTKVGQRENCHPTNS